MFPTKNFIAEMNKGLKLNGDNYKIWSKRIQMVLVEQNSFFHIEKIMKRSD